MKNQKYIILGVICTTLCMLCLPFSISANNVQVNNVRLKATNFPSQFTHVAFDISWENSWRLSTGPSNWDAAWIFVKYRTQTSSWQHATLNYVNGTAGSDGHTQSAGSTITTVPDGVGVFVYRDAEGAGAIDWQDIQLRWNYGADGVLNAEMIEVKVFAIEMVYVPQGSFNLGGGFGVEVGKFYEWVSLFNLSTSYEVNSETSIPVGAVSGSLFYQSPSTWNAGDQLGPIPAVFPKGYDAFYCMKYEVTQEQWLDFFNHLTAEQQVNNDITDLDHRGPNSIDRNTVQWEETGGAITTTPNVPLSFPLWGEIMAYMDWSGLRPMTELEFIKACRGPAPTILNQYAWGTNKIIETNFTYDLANKNDPDEIVVNHIANTGNANWINSSIFEDGPYRNGIFAASTPAGDREQAGASYYGIMEMSGNLSEMAVTIGTPAGRAFSGKHGDGKLTITGEADVNFWPPLNGNGGGLFGGSWFSQEEELRINDRRSATIGNIGYFNDVGFRCVRSIF